LLPSEDWRAIELSPKRRMTFTLADGTTVEREISECHITLPQGEGHTPVILGEPGDEPLLGIVTLEILGLVLNPFTRTLQPMRMLLVRGGSRGERERRGGGAEGKRGNVRRKT
jgi:predicted aspartyl protease